MAATVLARRAFHLHKGAVRFMSEGKHAGHGADIKATTRVRMTGVRTSEVMWRTVRNTKHPSPRHACMRSRCHGQALDWQPLRVRVPWHTSTTNAKSAAQRVRQSPQRHSREAQHKFRAERPLAADAKVSSVGKALLGGPWELVNAQGKPVTDADFR